MTITQFLIQILLTFAAAFLGASFTRRTERFKHLQELRSAAYADFLRGVATAAEKGGIALVADSRARIAIYGGENVVHSLSEFIALGAQTNDSSGMQAFAHLCMAMRSEAEMEPTRFDDISRLLFS